jgi:AcrR family transcriptional regulator
MLTRRPKRKQKVQVPLAGRRDLTRARLIRAARDVIAEKGFHRVSLDEIAARAGLTKGAVYDNFKSKDELFLAVVAVWATERLQRFAWPVGREGSLQERMRRLADAVIADAAQSQSEAPMRAEFLLYTLTHEEVRRHIAKAATQRFAYMRERVLQFVAENELAVPLDTFIVMFEALVPGLMFIRSQGPELVGDETIIAIFESFAAHAAVD